MLVVQHFVGLFLCTLDFVDLAVDNTQLLLYTLDLTVESQNLRV